MGSPESRANGEKYQIPRYLLKQKYYVQYTIRIDNR